MSPFLRVPQVLLGLQVRSGLELVLGGLWLSGDIRNTSPGFHCFDLHLNGKTN